MTIKSFFCRLFLTIQCLMTSSVFAHDWQTNSELTHAAPAPSLFCTFIHCPQSTRYERALEIEYWSQVQRNDIEGMKSWIKKTKRYLNHPLHQNQPKRDGRLMMLIAGGTTMVFNDYDLHALLPAANKALKGRMFGALQEIVSNWRDVPAISFLADSIIWSIKSNQNISEDLNARTFMLSIGSFAQSGLPAIFGISGSSAVTNTFYGPSCDSLPGWLKAASGFVCYHNGLMGPGSDSYKECVDAESCKKIGSGTEGIFAGALLMIMMDDPENVRKGLEMLGDRRDGDIIANCENYWCHFNNPNDPNALIPESTSIAPFKKAAGLTLIAEAYGKLQEFEKMERALAAAYAEAERINWPSMHILKRVDISLHGGDVAQDIPDMVTQWGNPNPQKDVVGKLRFPLPLSQREEACASCHFAGVLRKDLPY